MVDGAALCECHQGASHHPTLGHAQDMAEVTEAALANHNKLSSVLGSPGQ